MENLLKNNSKEMATIVETFVMEETAELIYDGEQLEKWNKYVEDLGLKGQTSIVKTDKSPIPFMSLKKSLANVFGTLCPRKVEIKDYNVTPIPVEILDLVALSVNEKYFDKIQIWYDDQHPDPVCIGMAYLDEENRKKGYTWTMQPYLLGKWADVKRSFSELTEMASKRWVLEEKNRRNEALKNAQRSLEDLQSDAFKMFGDNSTSDHFDQLPF